MASAEQKTTQFIKDNSVAVFSKTYCPYCRASKALLDQLGAKYEAFELDKLDSAEMDAIQDALGKDYGQRTVPQIFIAGSHIGGNSDLQAKKSQLPALLKEAGAV